VIEKDCADNANLLDCLNPGIPHVVEVDRPNRWSGIFARVVTTMTPAHVLEIKALNNRAHKSMLFVQSRRGSVRVMGSTT
jgi:hypothetical protein